MAVKEDRKRKKEILAKRREEKAKIRLISKYSSVSFKEKLSDKQLQIVDAFEDNHILVLSGSPGSGKTYSAIRLAVEGLKKGEFKKIYFIRPAIEAGEKLGFLPGDILQKMAPYVAPAFEFLKEVGIQPEQMIHVGDLEIVPIAFCKGRTFSKSIVIIDEAQDCTLKQLRLLMTRFGKGSKMIICGDPKQSDCPETPNSLLTISKRVWANPVEGIKLFILTEKDNHRHNLVPQLTKLCE